MKVAEGLLIVIKGHKNDNLCELIGFIVAVGSLMYTVEGTSGYGTIMAYSTWVCKQTRFGFNKRKFFTQVRFFQNSLYRKYA